MKKQKSLSVKLILISCAFILLISACSQKTEQPEVVQEDGVISAPHNGTDAGEEQVEDELNVSPAPDDETSPLQTPTPTVPDAPTLSLMIYGVDPELTELVTRTAEVAYADDLTVLKAMLAQLQENETENWLPLWKKIEFTSVNIVDGNVMIDLSFDDSARSGALVELYMIESLLSTVFQLPAVQTVTVLIDGEKADSLMGHVSIEQAFSRQ